MELAFAGLQLLCAPLRDRLEHLPGPQREALATAFGLRDGDAPDRFLVGLAVLEPAVRRGGGAAAGLRRRRRAVARRGVGAGARVRGAPPAGRSRSGWSSPCARRPASGASTSWPSSSSAGWRPATRGRCSRPWWPGPLDERVRDRIVAETHGNPLALLELPRGRTPAELAGGFGLDGEPALAGRIEARYQERLETLPEATRLLLLVAAAEPVGDPLLLWSAAAALGIDAGAGAPAADAGLIELGAQVRFHHPLVRSAVYGAAAPEDRRRVHRALADATDAEAEPDRRAWHRAQATAGLDEDVAAELERSAARARGARRRGGGRGLPRACRRADARSGAPGAACAGGRAVQAPGRRGRRGAAPAGDRAGRAAGRARQRAGAAAARADHLRHDARPRRAAAAARGGAAAGAARRDARARDVPRRVRRGALGRPAGARRRRARDRRRRPRRGVGAVRAPVRPAPRRARAPRHRGLRRGRAGAEGRAARVPGGADLRGGGAALAVAGVPRRPGPGRRRGLGRAHRPPGRARPPDRRAVRAADRPGRPDPRRALLRPARRRRSRWPPRRTPWSRRPAATSPCAAPSRWPTGAGRSARRRRWSRPAGRTAVQHGEGLWLVATDWGNAVRYNGLGRYDEALAAAERGAEDPRGLGTPMWLLADLVEAAARAGKPERAAGPLERLAEIAEANGTDWSLAFLARSRALLSEGEAAERLYREAIERLARTRIRVAHGRTLLVYGEWLRRENRRVDAREQLRAAHEHALRDRHGGLRRARPARAAGDGGDGAQAHGRDARRPHAAGAADRAARGGRADEPGDRRAAVPQPAHRRVAPAQGVRQARHQLAQGAARRRCPRAPRSP